MTVRLEVGTLVANDNVYSPLNGSKRKNKLTKLI